MHRLRGETDRALADLNRAIALSPQFIFALLERGDAYQVKGEYDQAIADYDRILAIQPNNATAQQRKQAATAVKQAGPGVAGAPAPKRDVVTTPAPQTPKSAAPISIAQETDVAKLFSLTEAQFQKGDVDGALATLNRIAAIDANNPKVYLYRGEVLLRKGELEAAASDLDRAIALSPNLIGAYIMRCAARLDLGKVEEAMADAEHLVRVAGNDARSFNVRGLARLQKSELEGALEDFERAITINPALGFVYENRALVHQAMQNRDLALADLGRALSLNPKSARAMTIRAQIYMSRGCDRPGHCRVQAGAGYRYELQARAAGPSVGPGRQVDVAGRQVERPHRLRRKVGTIVSKINS